MSSISAPDYAGRHRFGHPGLVYCRALLTRAGLRRSRRWFGLKVIPVRHGVGAVSVPVRASGTYQPTTRAA